MRAVLKASFPFRPFQGEVAPVRANADQLRFWNLASHAFKSLEKVLMSLAQTNRADADKTRVVRWTEPLSKNSGIDPEWIHKAFFDSNPILHHAFFHEG